MSLNEFLRKHWEALAVTTIGTLLAAFLAFLIKGAWEGRNSVWQWTLNHPTAALVVLVFFFGFFLGRLSSKGKQTTSNFVGTRLDRVANLFWLGNDLRYAREMAAHSSQQDLLRGLNQALHHSSELGLRDTEASSMLCSLIDYAQNLPSSIGGNVVRDSLGKRILAATETFSTLFKKYQPDFRPNPTA